MTTFISTAILLLASAGSYRGTGMAGGSIAAPYSGGPQTVEFRDDAHDLLLGLQTSLGAGQQDRVARTAFVVPGPDLAPEAIAQIREDLAVMCRIFDKASIWAKRTGDTAIDRTVPIDISGVEISQQVILTQALYLDGYGAVFFHPVDFPLAARREEQAITKTDSSVDPLWSQTANELRGGPVESRRPSDLPYNAQQVENLKIALIGTLRHAANLRTRGSQDAISIVIARRSNRNEGLTGTLQSRGTYGATMQQGATEPADLPTVLVLRTTRSDIDALAKGSLSQEQFAAKVQTLKSWTNPGPAEAGMGGFGGGGIMGGGGGMGGGMRMPSQNR